MKFLTHVCRRARVFIYTIVPFPFFFSCVLEASYIDAFWKATKDKLSCFPRDSIRNKQFYIISP